MRGRLRFAWVIPIVLVLLTTSHARAQTASTGSSTTSASNTTTTPPSPFDKHTKGLKKVEGMWTLFHNDQKLLVLLPTSAMGKNYLMLPSIARGISRGNVLGGMSWGFGDDVIWTFRKVGQKIYLIRRNVRFRAKSGTPEATAVKLAYSDSILYALPILATASGGYLVDMTRIFMSDDQNVGRSIGPGFRFAADRSNWAKVKGFPKNIELEVAAVYSGSGRLDTVLDPRGVLVHVHYSISELPKTDYRPRIADDRVGYFLTVVKDFSDDQDEEHFVRYINRWHLKKADPKAKLSPPTDDTQIVFYIEKTVPVRLRPIVEEAILEWNKAFEKLGFYKAIKVVQQSADDTRDPEDVRYNFFRWITAEADFAMGPSRVNPMTGQILDADIIFDAGFLKYWKNDYETFTPEEIRELTGPVPGSELFAPVDDQEANLPWSGIAQRRSCTLHRGMRHQMGFAAAALLGKGLVNARGELPEEFVAQALKEVVMHEVGHTLGLRHNFKASTWKTLEEINDPQRGAAEGIVASVMDYSPSNIVPKGQKQGLYYSTTIGPYDYWAIEYGYKPIPASKEKEELAKIASRCAEDGLDYATDEDTRSVDADPLSNRFDLGRDPVAFARRQMHLAADLLPAVVDRAVEKGEGYQRARRAFGLLLSEYWRSAVYAARFPGGVHVHRDHKGDPNGRPPFRVVPAERQREAMDLLAELAFASPQYKPETLNHLAATRWSHWGISSTDRVDYPIHDQVLLFQQRILDDLFSPLRLTRLADNELKVGAEEDAYTLAEHLKRLVDGIFTEWDVQRVQGEHTVRKPYISSFRRNLQREALKRLAGLVSGRSGVPADARTLARMHLTDLDGRIKKLLDEKGSALDDYSRAHLLDAQGRIRQVLEAELEVRSVD